MRLECVSQCGGKRPTEISYRVGFTQITGLTEYPQIADNIGAPFGDRMDVIDFKPRALMSSCPAHDALVFVALKHFPSHFWSKCGATTKQIS